MYFRFSAATSLICSALVCAMLGFSYWQWCRHLQKEQIVARLHANLQADIAPITSLSDLNENWRDNLQRRVTVSGTFDFAHEIVLRNRKFEDRAGVNVITPLNVTLPNGELHVLVNRGFVPLELSMPEKRSTFQGQSTREFVALIKEPRVPRLFIAPQDPMPKPGDPWADAWLRVDPGRIGRQMPYPIAPFYLETMGDTDAAAAEKQIVKGEDGRDELLVMGLRDANAKDHVERTDYPIPVFDTILPADRHLGYVFEWGFMALMTACIGLVLQLRRPKLTST